MKLLTRDTDYAIQAIMHIATAQEKIVSAASIQKELDLPKPFLRKILQTLQKSGILKSAKGNRGGFSLAKSPPKINMLTLMEIFQGEFTLTECFLKKLRCPKIATCTVRKKIKGIEKHTIAELRSITIKSLIDCA